MYGNSAPRRPDVRPLRLEKHVVGRKIVVCTPRIVALGLEISANGHAYAVPGVA